MVQSRKIALNVWAAILTSLSNELAGYTLPTKIRAEIVETNVLQEKTAQADIVVRTEIARYRFIRLRYSPHGFGFDAPIAMAAHLLPKERFADRNIVWLFKIHAPESFEEQAACEEHPHLLVPTPSKRDEYAKRDPFAVLRSPGKDRIPAVKQLPCAIIESWAIERLRN